MANCESNSIVTLDSNVQSVPVSVSESWQSKYFSREERDLKDEKSGKSGRRLYSVCKLETSDKNLARRCMSIVELSARGTLFDI